MMVLPVMRNLKLKFDSNIAEKIMNEERGVALRLLYQMKMALEKVSAPSVYQKSILPLSPARGRVHDVHAGAEDPARPGAV
jgi:hypothetical protein